MKFKCPCCEAEVDEYSKFCSICGHQLKKSCKKCNLKFDLKLNFCNQCGSPLERCQSTTFHQDSSQLSKDIFVLLIF